MPLRRTPVQIIADLSLISIDFSWADEAARTIEADPLIVARAIRDIARNGVLVPVSLNDDGSVQDGYHRILAALICAPTAPILIVDLPPT